MTKKISKWFSEDEVRVSASLPELAKEMVITPEILANATDLSTTILDAIREKFGAIKVVSFYRDKALNSAVGGESNSDHLKANAADIIPLSAPLEVVYKWIVKESKLPYKQVIYYPKRGFIHISRNSTALKRHEALVSTVKGKYKMYEDHFKEDKNYV